MAQLYIDGKPIHIIGELFERERILVVRPSPHAPSVLRYHDSLNLLDLELMAKLCAYEYSFNFHENYAEWTRKKRSP